MNHDQPNKLSSVCFRVILFLLDRTLINASRLLVDVITPAHLPVLSSFSSLLSIVDWNDNNKTGPVESMIG